MTNMTRTNTMMTTNKRHHGTRRLTAIVLDGFHGIARVGQIIRPPGGGSLRVTWIGKGRRSIHTSDGQRTERLVTFEVLA